MKRGLICYYSKSGTTKKAVAHLAKEMTSARFDFFDIASGGIPSVERYDIVGFATSVVKDEIPSHFVAFFSRLGSHRGKDAFLLNVGGSTYGHALFALAALAKRSGFKIVSGYSINAEKGEKPDREEISWFNRYIANLNAFLSPLPT